MKYLLCLALAVPAFAAGVPRSLGKSYCFRYDTGVFAMSRYMEGEEVFIFADAVKMRGGPATTHDVEAKLRIGTRVSIDSPSGTAVVVRGLGGYWYKVRVGKKRGYLFGPYLTRVLRTLDMDGDGRMEQLLLGYDKKLNAVLRVARKGRFLHGFAVKAPEQEGVAGCSARLWATGQSFLAETRSGERSVDVYELQIFEFEQEKRPHYVVPFYFDGRKLKTLKRR